jgi:hypothetical protein
MADDKLLQQYEKVSSAKLSWRMTWRMIEAWLLDDAYPRVRDGAGVCEADEVT